MPTPRYSQTAFHPLCRFLFLLCFLLASALPSRLCGQEIVSPVPGTVLPSSTVTFTIAPANPFVWFLDIGTTGQGSTDIRNDQFGISPAQTSVTVTGVPTTQTIFVSLWRTGQPSSRVFYTYGPNPDRDGDGMLNANDPCPDRADPLMTFAGMDYTLKMLGSQRVVAMESPTLFSATADGASTADMQAVTTRLFQKFNRNSFDFIFVMDRRTTPPGNTYGTHYAVSNDVAGIGQGVFNNRTAWTGSSGGKLQSVLHLATLDGLQYGPSLHEIMHRWGNNLTNFFPGIAGDTGHWGVSSVGGQLGGFLPNSAETFVNGVWRARSPRSPNRLGSWGLNANGGNAIPYAQLELYLMGMIPASGVTDQLWVPPTAVYGASTSFFTTSNNSISASTVTMAQITAATAPGYGPRVPDAATAAKSLRAMAVVLTDAPLTNAEWGQVDDTVRNFSLPGDDKQPTLNFWEATGGKGQFLMGHLGAIMSPPGVMKRITTFEATSITATSASLGGLIFQFADSPAVDFGARSEQGIVWSTSPSPTTASNKVVDTGGGTSFSLTVTGLPTRTPVYARAFATYGGGVGACYGEETYFVPASPTASSNANLGYMEISQPSISSSSGFNNPDFRYVHFPVGSNYTAPRFRANRSQGGATMSLRFNGGSPIALSDGVYTSDLTLNIGNNVVEVLVTAEDGITTKNYIINLTRRGVAGDENLSALTTTAGTISPAFAAGTTTGYTTPAVPNATTSTTITPTVAQAEGSAYVRVNSTAYTDFTFVRSGQPSSALPLNVGANTIDVLVIGRDGYLSKTYTLTVTRQPSALSNNADLASVAISGTGVTSSPAFAAATTAYTVTVPFGGSIAGVATKAQASAKLEYSVGGGAYTTVSNNGDSAAYNFNVAAGITPFVLRVTAENGTTVKSYTYTVNTTAILATVTTDVPSAIGTTSATLGGNVTSAGGGTISDRGIVWNTTGLPTIASTKAANGTGTGVFTGTVSSLPSGTLIYARAYATNAAGTAYGTERSFTTTAVAGPGTIVWGAAQNWTGAATQVLTNGVRHSAASFVSSTAANPVVNGVTFDRPTAASPANSSTAATTINFVNSSNISVSSWWYGGTTAPVTGSGDFGNLVNNASYHQMNPGTITIGSLVVGQAYQVQIFMPYWEPQWPTTFSSVGGASVTINGGRATGSPAAQYATGTFTAAATSHVINFSAAAPGPWAGLSAISVRRTSVSSDANLASLTTTAGALSPAFSASTTAYTLPTVPNSTASVTVTPTRSQAAATIEARANTGAYTAVTSGSASGALALNVGSNTIDVRVTAEDGTTQKTYTLTVIRAAATGTINWAAAGTFNNTPSQVANNGVRHSAVCFAPTVTTINGVTFVPPGVASGTNPVTFGSTPITATSVFFGSRPGPATDYGTMLSYGNWHQNTAGAITISNLQNGGSYQVQLFMPFWDYIYPVNFSSPGGPSITLFSSVNPANPSVVIGTFTASGTSQTITHVPGSVGGWAGISAISVRRLDASNDANLTALTTTAGSYLPTFAAGTLSYAVNVPNATTSTNITATRANSGASVAIKVNDGDYSPVATDLPLNVGQNTIAIRVTAEDTITQKTYTLIVTRAAALAGDPIQPTAVITSSMWDSAGLGGHKDKMINGNGLTGGGSVLTQIHDNNSNVNSWHVGHFSGGIVGGVTGTPPYGAPPLVNTQAVEFDLGGNYDLTGAHIWNFNGAGFTARGVKDVEILYSTSPNGPWLSVTNTQFSQAHGQANLIAQAVPMNVGNVRRVRFAIATAWSGLASEYVGLSEVRFQGTVTPPMNAIVAWGSPVTSTGVATQVYANGTRHAAVTFNPTALTVNGITFDPPATASPALTNTTVSTLGFANSSPITVSSWWYAPNATVGGTGTYGTLLSQGNWHQHATGKITINGLTVGQLYQVQLFAPYWDLSWPTRFSTVGGGSAVISSAVPPSAPGMVLGTFTATHTSQVIDYAGAGSGTDWAGLAAVSVRSITAPLSSNADLSALTTTAGALSPAFAAATTDYTTPTVPNSTASVTVTPTRTASTSTIEARVNGSAYAAVTSGSASAALPLTVGSNTINVRVIAEDTSTKTYTLTVTRLQPLLAGVIITPTAVNTTSQWGTAGDGWKDNLINGSGLSGAGSVETRQHDAAGNAESMWHAGNNAGGIPGGVVGLPPAVNTQAIEFDLGANYDLSGAHVWNMNQASVTERGVKGVIIQVAATATSAFVPLLTTEFIQGTGLAGLPAQVVTFTGATNVRRVRFAIQSAWSGSNDTTYVGLSEVRFQGTAAVLSTNADLASLSTTAGAISPAFAAGTTAYTASVPNATTSVTVTPTVAQANATVTVSGTSTTSGSASGAITLAVGTNAIPIVVTAQSGATKTYTITVTRAAAGGFVIDDFSAGFNVVTGGAAPALLRSVNGTTQFGETVSSSIIGNNRQAGLRDGHSVGQTAMTIQDGKLQIHGNASAPYRFLRYGDVVGTANPLGFPANAPFSSGTPAPLNLSLRPEHQILIDITQKPDQTSSFTLYLASGAGTTLTANISATTTGLLRIPLSSFAGMTSQFAADIDGIMILFNDLASQDPTAANSLHIDSISIATTLVIDDFSAGFNVVTGGIAPALLRSVNGTTQFGETVSSSIIGNNRQAGLRDGQSGGQTAMTIQDGKLQIHGNAGAPYRFLRYGNVVGTANPLSFPSNAPFSSGTVAPLNLSLRPEHQILIDITQKPDQTSGFPLTVTLASGAGTTLTANISATTSGLLSIPLSSFPGMTSQFAADIDGITILLNDLANQRPTAATGVHIDSISIAPPGSPGKFAIQRLPNGHMSVALTHADPTVTYDLQRSTNLATWTLLQTATTNGSGAATLTDPSPPAGKAFYRYIPRP